MEPIYVQNVLLDDHWVDRYGRLKSSMILFLAQEVGGQHSALLGLDYETLEERRLFWAVTRHRVQVTRIPVRGEIIRVETWPMPATRVAYPRSVVAYDADGNECFRVLTLWVLMNLDTRAMILPGRSGITVAGTVRGNELPSPTSLAPCPMGAEMERTVCYSDLDRNGHMNNTRCMDWIDDLLPSAFHEAHSVQEFLVCYLAEGREQQRLHLNWAMSEDGVFQVDSRSVSDPDNHRVFSAKILYK